MLEHTRMTLIPAALAGDWYPEPARWRWEGVATSSEPLVGMIFCNDGSATISWARSDHRASDAGLPIVLYLSFLRSTAWVYAGIGRPTGRGSVQARTTVQDTAPPAVGTRGPAHTGRLFGLASISGEPLIRISVLLINRRDVRSRRLGLW